MYTYTVGTILLTLWRTRARAGERVSKADMRQITSLVITNATIPLTMSHQVPPLLQ